MRLLWRYWCSEMVAAEEWDAGSMLSSFAALRISHTGKNKKPSLAEIEEVLRAEHEERGCSMTVLRKEVPVLLTLNGLYALHIANNKQAGLRACCCSVCYPLSCRDFRACSLHQGVHGLTVVPA